ncbi:MAG: hypothetical protein HRT71_04220 [Flavobacteriales bacterium]|nr:hypothetical protein [Flavobacteriales bacterium]
MKNSLRNLLLTALTVVMIPLTTLAGELPRSFKLTSETSQEKIDEVVAQLKTEDIILDFTTITFNKKGTKLISLAGTITYSDVDKTAYEFEAYKIITFVIRTMKDGKMGLIINARDTKNHPLKVD